MKAKRDLSDQQFRNALAREGMRPTGVLGYVEMGIPGHRISVSMLNTNTDRRRDILAFLRRERRRIAKREGVTL